MSVSGKKVAILAAPGFEDSELVEPVKALNSKGVQTVIIGIAEDDKRKIRGKRGATVTANVTVDETDAEGFDALLIPGGKSPAHLRKDERALDFVRDFHRAGKPIAAICHGPQVLASADLLKGRKATSYVTVWREIKRAGGEYRNQPVVVDGNIITSRKPGDIPLFVQAVFDSLKNTQRKTA